MTPIHSISAEALMILRFARDLGPAHQGFERRPNGDPPDEIRFERMARVLTDAGLIQAARIEQQYGLQPDYAREFGDGVTHIVRITPEGLSILKAAEAAVTRPGARSDEPTRSESE